MPFHGMLAVDKDGGCTSHDVVGVVRRVLGQRKVGHCGTLDPMATGLLLITAGNATRLSRFLMGAPKTYEGHIQLGTTTDTYDAEGEPVEQQDPAGVTDTAIDEAMRCFIGSYDQVAPAYSAKKVKGRKLYELARAGLEVPERRSTVEVFSFERIGPTEDARLPFRLQCQSGTYARSLAHDLGQRLGVGAHLASLRRTGIGPFDISSTVPLGELRTLAAEGSLDSAEALRGWSPMHSIPLPFESVEIDARGQQRVKHGQTVLCNNLNGSEGDWVRLEDSRGRFLAVGVVQERFGGDGGSKIAVIQPKVVFADS